jgi:hypothetical protein
VLESAVLAGLLGSIVATALAFTRIFWPRLAAYIMALVSASPWDAGKPEGSRVDHPFR